MCVWRKKKKGACATDIAKSKANSLCAAESECGTFIVNRPACPLKQTSCVARETLICGGDCVVRELIGALPDAGVPEPVLRSQR